MIVWVHQKFEHYIVSDCAEERNGAYSGRSGLNEANACKVPHILIQSGSSYFRKRCLLIVTVPHLSSFASGPLLT